MASNPNAPVAPTPFAGPLIIAMCGRKCDHDWSGREVKFENGSSASCAKCGVLAIDEDAWS